MMTRRRLYLLPVRGHLADARLMAAFAPAQNDDGDDGADASGINGINANAITESGGIVAIPAKSAADITTPNAAVVIILTYAGFDINAARDLLNALPACTGGVFCLMAQTPEGAPFLPKLRERANALQNDKNAVVIMELPAAAANQNYDEAAQKLREMILAGSDATNNNATTGAEDTNQNNDKTGGVIGNNMQAGESITNAASATPPPPTITNNKTPADAVRSAHKAVEDLL